jgi:N-acetylneuraminic acid mutarotase
MVKSLSDKINMKKLTLYTSILFLTLTSSFAQNGYWVMRDTFPADGRSAATGFNVGTAAYVSCGIDSAGYKRSTWLYNPATDIWTQVQSLGGTTGSGLSRDVTMSFVIGNNAYVVGGQGSIPYFADTWKYDAFNDTWTQVQNFGGGGRRSSVGFAINGKGYVALGQSTSGLHNDCWEYNPTTNTWAAKANYPGTARRLAVSFVINNIAYVGTGDDGVFKNDFYAYDPATNIWTTKASLAGTPRYGSVGFSVNNKGYVGFGYDNTLTNRKDFWEYNPTSNSWTAMLNFPGTARSNAVAVTCPNNRVYMGLGYDSLYRDDWWEFDPTTNSIDENLIRENQVLIYPNPMHELATINLDAELVNANEIVLVNLFDVNGRIVRTEKAVGTNLILLNRNDLEAGLYIVTIQTESHGSVSKRLLIQ